jgi:predicted membrane-bound spermidine synthase
MVAESALILSYQVKSGVLYQDLGLLITAFMAGLVVGSGAMHRFARLWLGHRARTRGLGVALLLSLGSLNLAIAFLATASTAAPMALTALGLLVCGVLVSALFAFASLDRIQDQRRAISPLYAADLMGGCIGSLAASLFLLPIVGISSTSLLMALLTVVTLLLL